jgi:hypothetical protein
MITVFCLDGVCDLGTYWSSHAGTRSTINQQMNEPTWHYAVIVLEAHLLLGSFDQTGIIMSDQLIMRDKL